MWSAGQVRKGNGADGAPHENGISIPSPRNPETGGSTGAVNVRRFCRAMHQLGRCPKAEGWMWGLTHKLPRRVRSALVNMMQLKIAGQLIAGT